LREIWLINDQITDQSSVIITCRSRILQVSKLKQCSVRGGACSATRRTNYGPHRSLLGGPFTSIYCTLPVLVLFCRTLSNLPYPTLITYPDTRN